MEEKSKPEATNVKASDIHGPSVNLRVLFLFGAFTFVSGFFIGGITLPYLRFKPRVEDLNSHSTNIVKDAALATIGPQTIWAAPMEGANPISTNLSVEQLITEYENLADKNGYDTAIEYANQGEAFEARFAFTPIDQNNQKKSFAPAPNKDFYKSLVLGFTRAHESGAVNLANVRKDGHEVSKGKILVDLINFGSPIPQLAPNQFLTQKGIFEIRSNEFGSIATIDGKQVFPILEKPAVELIKNDNPANDEPKEGAPAILRLVGVQSSTPNFKERFIIVASEIGAPTCTSKAIIVDATRDKTTIVPNMLKVPNLTIKDAPKSFAFTGFCEDAPKTKNALNLQVEVAYNLLNGELTVNHIANAPPPPPIAPNTPPVQSETAIAKGNWRQTSPNRIASPYGAGGALASITCNNSGGYSIAIAGLPAPADGKSSKVIIDSNHGSATAGMEYKAASSTYELSSNARPLEAKQMLSVLRGTGDVIMTGAGGRKVITAPGNAQIDSIAKSCGTQFRPIVQANKATPAPVAKP